MTQSAELWVRKLFCQRIMSSFTEALYASVSYNKANHVFIQETFMSLIEKVKDQMQITGLENDLSPNIYSVLQNTNCDLIQYSIAKQPLQWQDDEILRVQSTWTGIYCMNCPLLLLEGGT